MARVKVIVITGYGTNCEIESAHAARRAGADEVDIVYFSDLASGRVRVDAYNFCVFPGGFLDGDDLGAAQAAAQRWRHATVGGERILDQLLTMLDAGGMALGICNGFQLLVKLGLLPCLDGMRLERQVSLAVNDSARFEDRWVSLRAEQDSPCIFTRGIDRLEFPVRHGEGKLVAASDAVMEGLEKANLVALRYVDPLSGAPTQEYPYNPNGSPNAIAGLTDPTGRILGLMPHPEAYNDPTNHPRYTRARTQQDELPPLGTVLFENAVNHLRNS